MAQEGDPTSTGIRLDRSSLHRLTGVLAEQEPLLWAVAVGALLLDLGLTVYGLQHGLVERNLLGVRLLEAFGVLGLGLVKTAALGLGLAVRPLLPARYTFVVPLGLAFPWLVAVAVNLVVLAVR